MVCLACGRPAPPPLDEVPVPAGKFWMGQLGGPPELSQHAVQLSQPLRFGRTEVTGAQWAAVMGGPPPGGCPQGPELPVVCVTWREALELANALSRAHGLLPAYDLRGAEPVWDRAAPGFRLPTEAEWEFVARGGAREGWPLVIEVERMCKVGNVRSGDGGFPCDDGFEGVAPTGRFEANPYGVFDMAGNVAEWVWDRFAAYPEGAQVDPSGPRDGDAKVVRGGAWDSPAVELEPSSRAAVDAASRSPRVGVRLVRHEPGVIGGSGKPTTP